VSPDSSKLAITRSMSGHAENAGRPLAEDSEEWTGPCTAGPEILVDNDSMPSTSPPNSRPDPDRAERRLFRFHRRLVFRRDRASFYTVDREFKKLDLLAANPYGATRAVLTETQKTFLNVDALGSSISILSMEGNLPLALGAGRLEPDLSLRRDGRLIRRLTKPFVS